MDLEHQAGKVGSGEPADAAIHVGNHFGGVNQRHRSHHIGQLANRLGDALR
jgi:hypothetical protein